MSKTDERSRSRSSGITTHPSINDKFERETRRKDEGERSKTGLVNEELEERKRGEGIMFAYTITFTNMDRVSSLGFKR